MSSISKCQNCSRTLKIFKTAELQCQHKFCSKCIKSNLSKQILKYPNNFVCPLDGCNHEVEVAILKQIL